jgi:ribosomal protein S18 acetylase RimI-like enzyme
MTTVIRQCELSDLPALRQVAYQTYDAAYRHLNTPANQQAYLAHAFDAQVLRAQLINPQSAFYFLFCDDDLAGYLKVNEFDAQTDLKDPVAMEIERIYVLNAYQGRGLGRLLAQHALEMARAKQKIFVWLSVWLKNPGAIAFYRKLGFRPAGTRFFVMGDERQEDFVMRLDLDGVNPVR